MGLRARRFPEGSRFGALWPEPFVQGWDNSAPCRPLRPAERDGAIRPTVWSWQLCVDPISGIWAGALCSEWIVYSAICCNHFRSFAYCVKDKHHVGAMSVRKGQEWGAQARSPRGAASICRTGWLPWSQRHRRAAPVSGLLPAASATARTPPGLWRACPGPSTHCHRSRDAPVTEAAPTLATALEMPPDCEWSPRSAEQRGHGRWTALSPHGLES